jgi:hypothetical protein
LATAASSHVISIGVDMTTRRSRCRARCPGLAQTA